jgi:hypothetical protein
MAEEERVRLHGFKMSRMSCSQCLGSVSGTGSGFNQVSRFVSGSGFGIRMRIRIQEGKNYPQKWKKLDISCFEVLDVLFSFED